MAGTRDVYMNHLQQVIYYSGARDVRVSAARRFGKTDGTIAPRSVATMQSMPRGAGIWLGNSRKQLMVRTVPGTISAISRMFKLEEGTHFWWGQPPKNLHIPAPYIKPKDWSHCISFYNGFVFHLVSLAVPGSANGFTVNSIIGDECKFMSKAKIDSEVSPTLSGIVAPDGDPRFSEYNPYYKSTCYVSDASLSVRGSWLEKEEDKCDVPIEQGKFAGRKPRELQEELRQYSERVIFFNEMLRDAKQTGHRVMVVSEAKRTEIRALAEAAKERKGPYSILPPGKKISKRTVDFLVNYHVIDADDGELLFNYEYLITKEEYFELQMIQGSGKYQKHIEELRCATFAFYRASSLDNIDILGEDYIARMKRDLPPLVFAISILNLKKEKSGDGFYASLDVEHVHGYFAKDCPAVEDVMHLKKATQIVGGTKYETDYETPDFNALGELNDCRLDGDVHDDLPLYIAFDCNALINWICVGQIYKNEAGRDCLFVLKSIFTKNERKLRSACQDFSAYYAPHRKKNRYLHMFYDATMKQGGYADERIQRFKDIALDEFRKAGWEVNPIDMGTPMGHELKFLHINEGLAEVGGALPVRFNRENNEALLLAMERTEVSRGWKGFKKDKSGEKLSSDTGDENEVPLELRTDGTDAFDQLYIGARFFRQGFNWFGLPRRA